MQKATAIIEGFRLSPQQEYLWRLQTGDASQPYRVHCKVRIDGPLSIQLLNDAWRDVVARHEILRTTFHHPAGMASPLQVVNADAPPQIAFTDLTVLDQTAQERYIDELFEGSRRLSFDFEFGPLARLSLFKQAEHEYSLLITLPALLGDAVALDNLSREICASYAALSQGGEVDDEQVQYAVFAEWLDELISSEDTEAGKEFWRDLNLSAFPELRLPFEGRPNPNKDFAPLTFSLSVDQKVSEKIETACERYGTTASTFLLACWQVLLGRLSGETDLLAVSRYSGRTDDELKKSLGLFARFLPMPCRLQPDLSFAGLMEIVGENQRAAEEWQECYSWELAGASGGEAPARPFHPFSFEYEPQPVGHVAGAVSFLTTDRYACIDRFKIKLSMTWRNDALITDFHYDSMAFSREDVERLAERYHKLLESAADDSEAVISSLDILSDSERRRLLIELNRTEVDYGQGNLIHKIFEAQVEHSPNSVAVEFEGLQLSYAELNERANRLAHYLIGLGVKPGGMTPICMERSPEMVVGLLGILKAGGTYVPLDPTYPRERIRFILNDAQPVAILTTHDLAGIFQDSEAQIIQLDVDWFIVASGSPENPESGATEENLAYVIYTSGSTGEPKGVMISHRSICNRLLWTQSAYPLTETDNLLQKTVFSFDASVWEFFVPLFAGARLTLARPGGHRDSAYLADVIAEREVTTLQLVPTMLHVMLEEPKFKKCKSLRRVFSGGETLAVNTQEQFFVTLDANLINLYGPTEVAIDATSWNCERVNGHAGNQKGVPIGKPLSNARVYVLDTRLHPAPAGVAGELHVGGVGVARGYLNRPELTAERFIPDPFGDQPGGRLYKTGDFVRYGSNEVLEYQGRMDQQVKLRGFRIELGEVEAALRRHPSVKQAVAVVREDEPGAQRLVAYVIGSGGQTRPGEENGQQWYRLRNNLDVAHLNRNETELLYREVFEDGFYLRNGVTLSDGACVFDVGANIGLFTLFVHDRCRDARVFAFEPIPVTHKVLERNIERYGLEAKAYQCGLSDRSGPAIFTFYPKVSASSGMYADANEDEAVTRAFIGNQGEEMKAYADELMEGRFEGIKYECELRTASDVIRENGIERIDLLKVDVEKSELDVLLGVKEEDWSKIKQVVMEVHDRGGRLERIVSLLERHGFQLTVEQYLAFEDTGLYNVYAVHPSKRSTTDGAAERSSNGSGRLPRESSPDAPSADELRQFLIERLPDQLVPSAFMTLDEFPLLPNGKVNRLALPPVEIGNDSLRQDAISRTPTEELVGGLWAKTLGMEQVGIYENFFDLGGHSLLATQVISRLREAFQVEIPLRAIFETPNVASLSKSIEAAQKESLGFQAPPILPIPRNRNLPLSFAQQRLWFLDQLKAGNPSFNVPVALRLTGKLNVSALERTQCEVIRRHESLRTTFSETDGEPAQIIHPAKPVALEIVDLSGFGDADERENEARRLATEEARRSFDLSSGPLLRSRLLYIAEEEHILLFTMHHIISDGWSMGVLVREVSALYQAFSESKPSPLADLPIQYADYASWQREWLTGAVLEGQLAYWRQQLDGAPLVLELPTDRPRPETQSYQGARLTGAVSPAVIHALKQLGREEGATLFMTLLAAFKVLLSYYSGKQDMVVGTNAANRNRPETEGLIGFFINQLVLRTDLSGDPTFRKLLGRVRAAALGAYAHEDLPFEKLVDVLKPERDASRAPLFQVKLALQNAPVGAMELPGLTVSAVEFENNKSNLDLILFIRETEQGAKTTLEYNTDLFDAATATRILEKFELLLGAVSAQPGAKLSELREVLSQDDAERLRAEKNRLEQSSFTKFKNLKPKTVSVSQAELVRAAPLFGHTPLPLLVEPKVADVDLIEWARANREFIETKLLQHGAVLFRGFGIDPMARFNQFARAVCSDLFNENGEHPRQSINGDVYTPVFYPPEQKLLWHNENSFNHTWPGKILFCCAEPAALGGETPVVDSRRIFETLAPRLRERFVERGVMYVRNYGNGLGLDWQKVFQTSSKAEVEERFRNSRIEFEWKEGGRLRTRCVRPAAVKHPRSAAAVWFNQAQHWHVSCLDPLTRESIAAVFREEDYPRNCYYGDGSPIEDSVMKEILAAYQEAEIAFPWQAGDILMLDNLLTAHARQPFVGERKLLVAMGEMHSYDEVETPLNL